VAVTLHQRNSKKMGRVDIICPAFSADCLETLEEIRVENCDFFIEAGEDELNLIECLNDRDSHIEMMAAIVDQYLPK
jgi:ferrochelatase